MSELSDALNQGRLANPDAVMQIRSSIVADSPAGGSRAIDIGVINGISLRILPDRGFDIGPAWFHGLPLAWVSAVGETGPMTSPVDWQWGDAFGGGLMVTCGLRNVGMPSEGHGLHGTFSHLRARDVNVERRLEGSAGRVVASATIDDVGAIGHHLRLERVIGTWAGQGRVQISDVTTNLGRAAEAAPILYHFNFGYPLWGRGSRLELAAETTTPRDQASAASLDTWDRAPEVEDSAERVLEHTMAPDDEGWGWARIINPSLGIRLSVGWRMAELPRLHQWIHPGPGIYVLGIEPANCSTGGRAHDRAEGRLPQLEPGERRETSLVVMADHL